jgi:cytochrome b
MSQFNGNEDKKSLNTLSLFIHLGIMIFGIAAWLTGPLADDYKKIDHSGFIIHSWVGICIAAFAALRLITGIIGSKSDRFARWMPFTGDRLKTAAEDIRGLLKFRMPERQTHQGLAGVVQTFGLAVFFLMAATGAYLYFFLEPGQKAQGLVHDVKELHEIGMALIPVFLFVHVGAVIMHAINGKHIWKKIFFISDTMKREK